MCADDLSKVVSAPLVQLSNFTLFSLPLVGTVDLVTVDNSTISNQLVPGSIIVRHMQSILEPSLPLRVWGSMRSTHNALQGVVMTSFGDTCPYFWLLIGKIYKF